MFTWRNAFLDSVPRAQNVRILSFAMFDPHNRYSASFGSLPVIHLIEPSVTEGCVLSVLLKLQVSQNAVTQLGPRSIKGMHRFTFGL